MSNTKNALSTKPCIESQPDCEQKFSSTYTVPSSISQSYMPRSLTYEPQQHLKHDERDQTQQTLLLRKIELYNASSDH